MMLATLHGKRNLGCGSCGGSCGSCSNCTDCKSLSVLSGYTDSNPLSGFNLFRAIKNVAVDTASSVYDTASNVGDVVLAPVKAAGSTIADVASGDFDDALHDFSRMVTSGVLAIPNASLALTSNIPGMDGAYDAVIGFEQRHPEEIALASIAAAATVVSMGGLGPGILASYGITPAMMASVEAGVATTATTIAVGKALLDSGTLSTDQRDKVTASMDSIYNSGYKESSGAGWLLAAIPAALAFL